MKKLAIFSVFVVAFLSICQAQDTVRRIVPLLKESTKVDSLILSIINIPEYLKAAKNDSCIVLSLSKNDVEKFVYGVPALNHKEIIFDFGNLRNKKSLGYFEFNGYLIFVFGDAFMNKFFTYKTDKKEFAFVNPKVKDPISWMRNYLFWAVIYRDGELYYGVH